MTSLRTPALAALVVALLARPGLPAENAGGALVGWVEDSHGVPVAGAVISLFGTGIRGGSLVTFSDNTGRFFLPSLPAGSYTLRAIGTNFQPAPARRVTVQPDQDATARVSLAPIQGEEAEDSATASSEAARELRWLIRHKRRSVLEEREHAVEGEGATVEAVDLSPRTASLLDVDGSVEVITSPAALGLDGGAPDGEEPPLSFSVLRLAGKFAENGRWSLGGLVTESESRAWRMAAEFVVEPGGGHEITAGSGYGLQLIRPIVPSDRRGQTDNRTVGAVYVRDRWRMGDRFTADVGLRQSYVGFVSDRNHLDPHLALELHGDSGMHMRAALEARTIVPGGDILTLSARNSTPPLAFAVIDEGLRPERLQRLDFALGRSMGATTVEAHAFHEAVRDQLVNAHLGAEDARSLRILNARGLATHGVGITVARAFGSAVRGSVSYTYGHSLRREPMPGLALRGDEFAGLAFRRADFHDVAARVETFVDWTDTRVAAYCRFNSLDPDSDGAGGPSALASTRFDVQVAQGLPFLGTLTRAEWELLLAFRNLFYEVGEGAVLDELAVLNPPKRVLGGISVRF